MTRIRLCGGGAHDQVMEIRQMPPPDLRIPIMDTPEMWTPDAEIAPQTTVREEIYYLTGIVSREGEFVYAAHDVRRQMIDAIAPMGAAIQRFSEAMQRAATVMQGSLSDCDPYAFAYARPARMSGAKEYPWDAMRQDTEELIGKIDDVTDEGEK